ncbi:MAG: VWA domain-containing protein [Hominenteromicrobium sp.]
MKSKVTVRRLLAMVLCFALVLSLGVTAFADDAPASFVPEPVKEPCGDMPPMEEIPEFSREISKSKTAANLDENYESQVTLSLPAADAEASMDVVLVLDVSGCKKGEGFAEAKAAVSALCDELAARTNLDVKIGIVTFGMEAQMLTDELVSAGEAKAALDKQDELESAWGANMMAGLMLAKEMLDESTAAEKHLVILSGGAPAYWADEDGEPVSKIRGVYTELDEAGKPVVADADRTAAGFEPERSMNDASGVVPMEELLKITDWNEDSDNWYINGIDNQNYQNGYKYSNLQKSIYMTAQYLSANILGRYPVELVAYGIDTEDEKQGENDAVFQYWKNFCGWIGEQSGAACHPVAKTDKDSGSNITKTLCEIADGWICLLDAGSTVEDVIGGTEDYDFQFVNDAAKLSLTVGGETLAITKMDGSTYGFGDADNSGDSAVFPFVLHYYADGKGETLVWDINVPITKDVPVQLTYSVKLTNPKTEPGTYGSYDADGSKGCDGLYTNNSAVLKPAKGGKEAFPKPTVSYTVQAVPNASPTASATATPAPAATAEPTAAPTAAPAATPAPTNAPAATPVPTGPKTGDSGVSPVWFVLAGVSVLGAAGVLIFRKRRARK